MRRFLFTLCIVSCAFSAMAIERTSAELERIALAQLQKASTAAQAKRAGVGRTLSVKLTVQTDQIAVYTGDGLGSVLISKDDQFVPVLGYTDAVITDFDALPCCMKWWLGEMEQQMQTATAKTETPYQLMAEQSAGYTVTPEIVTTKWGQSGAYGAFTPEIDGENPPAGCVATAMAQIMNYNQWPKKAQFTGSYSIDGGKTTKTVKVNTTYSYPLQKAYGSYSVDGSEDNISSMTYPLTAVKKIGWLLRDCGYASDMSYTLNGSGTTTVEAAAGAVNFMSYPKESIKSYLRTFYTDDEWHNLAYSDIMQGYPVLYGGNDSSFGGHAFVAHGIDANGLLAVNWGWNGYYDGYYVMDAMNPTGYSFDTYQMLVTGWHPTALSSDRFISQWVADATTFKYDSETKTYTVGTEGFFNYSPQTFTGTVAMCFEDESDHSTNYIDILTETDGSVATYYGFSLADADLTEDVDFLQKGHTYKVYFTSQDKEEETPQMLRTTGGRFYYTLTIAADGTVTIGNAEIDTTSGISTASLPTAEQSQSDAIFNLQGQRISKPAKGIYIQNGRKFTSR